MAALAPIVPVLILVGTILAIAFRPLGIREGTAALLGAAFTILAGWATVADAWYTTVATSRIMLFLIGMMVIATVVAAAAQG